MEAEFSTPSLVQNLVEQMLQSDLPRANNRARINGVFNGDAPYTDQEARENRVSNNINFLEGTRIIHQARSQFSNSFMKPGNFFSVRLDSGPLYKRQEWGSIITREINRVMKRSPRYFHTLEASGANFVLHGPAPVSWIRINDWCPVAKGVEDLLVPTRTLTDLSNMPYFTMFCEFTARDLMEYIKDPARAKAVGWNVDMVSKIIGNMLKVPYTNTNQLGWDYRFPEKAVENYKSDFGYWGSDAAPTLRCWDFYYLTEKNKKPVWQRKIVLAKEGDSYLYLDNNQANEFLFDAKDRPQGDELSQMIHVLIGDGAVKAPFRYHSVRSLGYLLYAVCHLQNRMRCKFTDAAFESMLWYFRNVTDGDGERLEKIDLHHLGIIPEGLSWVPMQERHQVDFNMLSGQLQQNRQLMAESSSSFVQDTNSQSGKEMTATEIMARVNNSSALLGSMMTRCFTYMTYQYLEIARRFCILDSPDCKKFRERCMMEGVDPAVFKNIDAWDIEPERVMGSGNKTLELAAAQQLMAIRPLLNPEAQQMVLRDFVLATTDDPKKAQALVPINPNPINNAQETATLAWGTLIDGKPVVIAEGINRIDFVETLIQLLNMEMGQIEQMGEIPNQKRLMGLQNVIQFIGQQIEILAQDEAQGDKIKQYQDILGRAMNMIKGYAQRLAEQQQAEAEAQGGMDPKTLAKVQEIQLTGEMKRQQTALNSEQKRVQKEIQMVGDQARKDEATRAEIARTNARTMAQINSTVQSAKVQSAIDVAKSKKETQQK